MKCMEYKPRNMSITKEPLQSVKQSNASYKKPLQTKKKSQQKLEKDKRLLEIDEELIQLNRKKSSIEEAIKRYHLERDRHAVNAEKKKNRIIKDVNQL